MELTVNDITKCLKLPNVSQEQNRKIIRFECNPKKVENGVLYHRSRNLDPDCESSCLVEATENGATVALVEKTDTKVNIIQLPVKNVFKALGSIAKMWRDRFNPYIIAITGSCGKTTTKNLIGQICSDYYGQEKTLVTIGNLNGMQGIPFMLSLLRAEHQVAVLEVGTSEPGDMEYFSSLIRPNMAIITNIMPVHIEKLRDVQGIAEEKGNLIRSLPQNSKVIINSDCPYSDYFRQLANADNAEVISFGKYLQSNVQITEIKKRIPLELSVQVKNGPQMSQAFDIDTKLYGEHMAGAVTGAITVGLALGVPMNEIVDSVGKIGHVAGRGEMTNLTSQLLLIDDSYSANPSSTKAAIDLLSKFSEKKFLVFADMAELGQQAIKWHVEIGKYAKNAHVDSILAFGKLAKWTTDAFGNGGLHFENDQQLFNWLLNELKVMGKCTLLVKGSNNMNTNKIIEKLKLNFNCE